MQGEDFFVGVFGVEFVFIDFEVGFVPAHFDCMLEYAKGVSPEAGFLGILDVVESCSIRFHGI